MQPGVRSHEGASLLLLEHQKYAQTFLLCRLYVRPEERGQDKAKRLLSQVCEEADKAGVNLMLEIEPFADAALDVTALQMLYQRFGFLRRITDQHGNSTDLKSESGVPMMWRLAR